jgi:hypothetical protein
VQLHVFLLLGCDHLPDVRLMCPAAAAVNMQQWHNNQHWEHMSFTKLLWCYLEKTALLRGE